MLAILSLLGLIINLVQAIRSGVSEVSGVVNGIGDILRTLTPTQKLAVSQFAESTADAGERAALRWLMDTGHGPTTTDEARDLRGVVLTASGDAGPGE